MRVFLCVLLLACQTAAQSANRDAPDGNGTFFVNGIVYQFDTGVNGTVVTAAHSVLNHKFLAVKVRVYNAGQHSISVRPEDVLVEDAIGGQQVTPISSSELARRMRKPYNMARYAVNGISGGPMDPPADSDTANPQLVAMMKAMAAQGNDKTNQQQRDVVYKDTAGTLENGDGDVRVAECDQVCHLRNREAHGDDALIQLQRQTAPEAAEEYALLANTIPPGANVGGVLYYPLGKLSAGTAAAEHGRKERRVRVSVLVMGENFRFELPVE